MEARLTSGLGHVRTGNVGEADTPGTRLGNLGAAQNAGRGGGTQGGRRTSSTLTVLVMKGFRREAPKDPSRG